MQCTIDNHLKAAKNALDKARNEGTASREGTSNGTPSQLVSNQPQQVFTRPTKMDDMLKPKRKLEDKMNYEQSLQWFIEFRRHITLESNERFLDAQTPSVRQGILEGCISANFATHLRAKAIEETPLDECLGILEKIFLDKNPIWARRKAWFDCHQREDESVSQWWDRKVEISKDCDLKKMTTDEICLLQFMLGIHKKEKRLKEEMLKIKEPKLDDLLVLAQNWERSENLAKELSKVLKLDLWLLTMKLKATMRKMNLLTLEKLAPTKRISRTNGRKGLVINRNNRKKSLKQNKLQVRVQYRQPAGSTQLQTRGVGDAKGGED